MKLTIEAMVPLARALRALDGGDAPTTYKLAGSVRMALAKNLARLDAELLAYEKARMQLARDHADPGAANVKPEMMEAFTMAHEELVSAAQEVDLIRLTEPLLNLDVNALPVAVLVALMPIMKDAAESSLAVSDSTASGMNGAAPHSDQADSAEVAV